VSAKVDYALRAMVHLAAENGDQPVRAEEIAQAQGIPQRFLLGILAELKHARLVQSHRGKEGGYNLSRPASEISLAEIMRVVDGPLVNVRDSRIGELRYAPGSEPLEEVWMAVRASVRSVLEAVTVADLVSGSLPDAVRSLASDYRG
jgi:Rrf2 family protein